MTACAKDKTLPSIRPQALFLIEPALDSADNRLRTVVTNLWSEAVSTELARQSPLRNVSAELPPTAVFAGTADPLEDQAVQFCARAKKIQRPCEAFLYEGGPHGFAWSWYGLTNPAIGLKAEVWEADILSKMDTFLIHMGWLGVPPEVRVP